MQEPHSPTPNTTKLSDKVGNGRANRPEDVVWLKQALHCLGRYNDAGERHGYIDRDLQDAIENYQRDRGLERDGYLRPNGETEQTLRVELVRLGEERV